MNNELLPVVEPPEIVEPPENSIRDKINELTTAAALQDDEMRSKLVVEKGAELSALSEARRIEAESERQRAVLQKEHERAEHSSRIFEAESTELQSKALKAKAFYDANKAVLNIIGIREPLGLRTMCVFYAIALPLYIIFSILISFPVSVINFIVGIVIDTVGQISKKVASTFLKVTTGILSVGLTGGVVAGIVFLVKLIFKI
ncbi:MAG: hypothetical protein ACLSUU_03105 [Christensenellales bacterium]|jgi:hypothetical protein|nr:MAG TPA: hypothetical protein [Caudoviricetes sp.]